MGAANHPAPPMPLTEHKGDPVEMAMLDPMQRASRNVEERAEFQRFFGEVTSAQPAAGESKTEQPAAGQSTIEQPTAEQSPIEQPTTQQPTTEPSKTGDNE
jgi:hypothetical protein